MLSSLSFWLKQGRREGERGNVLTGLEDCGASVSCLMTPDVDSFLILPAFCPSCNVIDLKLCPWSTTDSPRTLRAVRLIGRRAPSQSCSSIPGCRRSPEIFPLQLGPDSVLLQHQYLALKLSFSLSERPSSILTENLASTCLAALPAHHHPQPINHNLHTF